MTASDPYYWYPYWAVVDTVVVRYKKDIELWRRSGQVPKEPHALVTLSQRKYAREREREITVTYSRRVSIAFEN
jgi:hypothetical protein